MMVQVHDGKWYFYRFQSFWNLIPYLWSLSCGFLPFEFNICGQLSGESWDNFRLRPQAGSPLSASCWNESIWTALCQRARQPSGNPPLALERAAFQWDPQSYIFTVCIYIYLQYIYIYMWYTYIYIYKPSMLGDLPCMETSTWPWKIFQICLANQASMASSGDFPAKISQNTICIYIYIYI